MQIIDLSLPIYNKMPVYPGDPEVEIKQIHSLEKEGWRLRSLKISSHLGTHINIPSHMVKDGKTLDDLSLDNYCGLTAVYQEEMKIKVGVGLIFRDKNIDEKLMELLIKIKPKFVGLSAEHEFDIEIEKKLFEAGIISYENLVNTEKLPNGKKFMFYGFPLKIRGGDGSPVRAVAVIK